MSSAQRNGGADATPQREEKRTETTVQMNRDTPTTQRRETGDIILSMYPFQWASCHIQYTFNSSHKINLFSLQFKIK